MSRFSFERTSDLELARSILTRRESYWRMGDDSRPPREEFALTENLHVEYVLVKDGEETIGLVVLVYRSRACCESHVCMLPESWGERAWEAAPHFLPWLWANTDYVRAVGNIAYSNSLALRYASRCGFHPWGVNEKAILRNGKLQDEIWVGATRPETQ